MSLQEHVRNVLSDLNRHGTRQALGLEREPTHDELVANYQKHVIITSIHSYTVAEEQKYSDREVSHERCSP